MIRGVISASGIPTITITVAGRDWHATIDTGFNGDLELPEILKDPPGARYVGRVTSALAGGQSLEEEVFIVQIPFDGRMIQAEATFVGGSQLLIGTHFLREYSLQIDFARGTVEVDRR